MSILYVMAARAEYGPALAARIDPLFTGVGPVEAAVVLSAHLAQNTPRLVVSLGSAGSARLDHCGVYQAGSIAYRDMDASALGFARGVTPFLDQGAVIDLPLRIPDVPVASLSTGANVVSGAGYDSIAQDMVDMETWAIARCCQHHNVPLIALRGISDGAAPLQGLHDWTEYLPIIDAKLAQVVDRLHESLDVILP